MRFSSTAIIFTLTAVAAARGLPGKRDVTLGVTSDEGTEQVTVPNPVSGTVGTDATGAERGANVGDAVVAVVNAVLSIIGAIGDDINARKQFTQQTVARVRSETGLNVVMSNVGYQFQGTPVSVTSTKYKAKIGSDVSFDVVTFDAGTFDLKGNGGFQNWAFIVDATCVNDAKAKHVSCT